MRLCGTASLFLRSRRRAASLRDAVGWGVLLPLYAALSFALVAAAYGGAGPRLLLKQASGRRSLLGWLLFAPYLALSELTFGLHRLLSREPAYVQVAPNVFFGRRLSDREHRSAGWSSILDLAGEFSAARTVRARPGYRSLPVLDGAAPTEGDLHGAAAFLADAASSGPVYVHCALGHGRSACVVIAYLLSIGAVSTVAEGCERLRALRPGVRLHGA